MEDAAEPGTPPVSAKGIAAKVAERYAKAPTYSEILASEARNAARAAQAAAVAACDARDAAEAILIGLDVDRYEDTDRGEAAHGKAVDPRRESISQSRGSREVQSGDLDASPRQLPAAPAIIEAAEEDDSFGDGPPARIQPLPAKLLEFPRELVATRKARPRLVEGPLREEYDRDASQSQLRIFEVESETISTEPAAEAELSGWSSIRLDSEPGQPQIERPEAEQPESEVPASLNLSASRLAATTGLELPLQTASLEDRLMAGIVDAALIVGGFLVFVLVFVACTPHPPIGKPAAIGACVAFFAFCLIYQILFFSFGQDTPGMRYAKVALCTFDDENPTRQALRKRIVALLLAACPLGIGVLWAFFDDDRLGWHDRISRTYQRSYR